MRKVAFVTGGSRGIGRAIAVRLAAEGYAVGIGYLQSREQAGALAETLRLQGADALAVQGDVADREAITAAIRSVEASLGPVSVLVNNAGIAGQCQFQDIPDSFWHRMFAVNVDGAFHTIQAVLPHMIHEKSGSIVNISSMWGLRGASCEAAYSATKAALIGLTRSLAVELAPSGIRVNCVAPGVILTDMVRTLGEDTLHMLAEQTPLGRIGAPEDIAGITAFLAGDGAAFITGQVVTADGGFIV
ncbi:MAG: 3-oxoacyl-ACP reductase FabG [Oscillospiraceae bacterium]|nr:3-oxoacyl-ACP reductase FabG [Oscillospiraceae bacterium]